jgi:hypothetical protein
MISNVVMRDPSLSMQAKYLYGLLKSYAWQDSKTYPGVKTLCASAGVGKDTLGKYLKELVDAQLLEVRRRGQGKTNLYIFKKIGKRSNPDGDTGSHQEREEGGTLNGDASSHNEDSVNEDSSTNSRKGADALADVMVNPGKYFSNLLKTAGKEPTDRERERCFVHMKQLIDKHDATRVEMEKIASSGFQAHMNGYEWWPKDLLRKLRQGNVTPLRPKRGPSEQMVSTAGYREFS